MGSESPKLTLYRANGVVSFVPHVLLRELSIPFTDVCLNRTPNGLEAADGSLSPEDYRKIHYAGYVPALQVDDVVITETPAILTYIASLRPDKQLLGTNNLERAKAVEWMTYLPISLHNMGFGMLIVPHRFASEEAHKNAVKEIGRENILTSLARINSLLTGREFPVGQAETVVDYYLTVFWYWTVKNKFSVAEYPAYAKLVRRMEAKESVQQTAKLEGVKLTFQE